MQSSIKSYEDLITVLEQEFDLCSEMVTLLQKEKDIIAGLDLEALERHLREKELVASKISVCEEARARVLQALGLQNKTLTEIAAAAGSDYGERLSFISSKFKSITNSIAELNTLNGLLIERSLFYVKSSRRFLDTFGIAASSRISVEV
jgi:flagellar biosynthesis/type III secretory pathway chaperone